MSGNTDLKTNLKNFSLPFIEDKIDLRSIVYTLLAEKKLIIMVTLIGLVLSIIYAILIVPQYQANLLIQVENKQSGADLLSGNALLGGLGKESSPADVQTTLIKSPFILVPVVESLGLDVVARPHYFPVLGAWFARGRTELHSPVFGLKKYAWGGEHLEVTNMHISLNKDNLTFKLIARQNQTYELVTSDGKRILTANVGQLAKIKNNNLELTILVKSMTANPGTEFFLSKLSTELLANKIASRLDISDLGQMNQVDKTGILQISLKDPSPQKIVDILNTIGTITIDKDTERKSLEAAKTLQFLEDQLPLVKNGLKESESNLDKYRMKSGTIDLNIKSKILLRQLSDVQRELSKAELSRIMLLQQLTPAHPYIIALNSKKVALQTELNSLESQLSTLPSSDQVAVGLIRDIKVKSQLYLILLHKIQELEVVKGGTISDVRILNWAHLPDSCLPTGRFWIILCGLLMGFVAGAGFVVARKSFLSFVEDPNWLEQHFGIPTFAIIPYSSQQKSLIKDHKENNRKLELLAQNQPRDLSIEALRSLRTSLQFALIGAKNNIISIMGISPGIGKSFVSANFSYLLAESNKRVLLIDGDIRKGYLQDYFSVKRAPGLSEIISGEIPLEHVIHKTNHPNLDFIATGHFPPNPSELLLSNQFKEILSAVSTNYDLVIIDTAPVLAVTDGIIIANQSGINFLCIAGGVHQAPEIELAIKRLQSNEIRIQGTIYNNIHANNATQGRYNYYYAYDQA